MKQGRVSGITIAVINLILIAVCAVLYLGKDREKPQFAFEATETVYREDMDTRELLEGVTAFDGTDGDVTERIVIEKITGTHSGSARQEISETYGKEAAGGTGKDTVTVFYVVSDEAGNVAKASRVFDVVFDGEEGREEDLQADIFLGAGIDAELNGRGTEPENPENQVTEDAEAGGEDVPVLDRAGAKETASPTPTAAVPTSTPSPALTALPEMTESQAREHPAETPPASGRENAPTGQASQAVENTENSAAPVLTLKVQEIRVRAGQGPAWVDLISVLSDDRDNYETLFRNLYVDRYDRDKPGTYQVNVHTEDSDGNVSPQVPLTIIVE